MNTVDWMALLQSRGIRTFILKDVFDLAGALRKATDRRNLAGVLADPQLATRLTELGVPLHPGNVAHTMREEEAAVVVAAGDPGPRGEILITEDWPGRGESCRRAGALFVVVSLDQNHAVSTDGDGWRVPWPPETDPERLLVVFL